MQRKRTVLLVVLLLVVVLVLYGQFLWNPLVFDDLPLFTENMEGKQHVTSLQFSLLEPRSLPYATLAWSVAGFGLDLIYFRLENLALHAAVALALFFFFAQLFAVVMVDRNKAGWDTHLTAFFAAMIFVLHPVATYAVGYLVQRTIIMATLFSLLALLVYMHGSVRQKPFWLWLSVAFYYLAVLSKEHAIMLPAALLALTMLLHDDWRIKIKQRWGIFVSMAGIALFVILTRKALLGSMYEHNALEMLETLPGVDTQLSFPFSVLTQSWLFFKYIGLWLIPNTAWMSIDVREPFAQSLLSVYLIACVGFVIWGVGAFCLLLKRGWFGLLGFALLFPWLMFFTELSTVRVQEPFVLYRSYLWMVGLCSVIPLLFFWARARLAIVSLSLICVLMMFLAWDRLTTFSHPLLLWDDAVRLVEGKPFLPGMERIYHNRATALSRTKLKHEALADFDMAIRMKPNNNYAYNDRGALYYDLQRYAEALNDFNSAIAMFPAYANTYQGRGMVYQALGDLTRAREDYKKSCELDRRRCYLLIELMKHQSNAGK